MIVRRIASPWPIQIRYPLLNIVLLRPIGKSRYTYQYTKDRHVRLASQTVMRCHNEPLGDEGTGAEVTLTTSVQLAGSALLADRHDEGEFCEGGFFNNVYYIADDHWFGVPVG